MNSKDVLVLKKIIQYSEEIAQTLNRFNNDRVIFEEDFVYRNAVSMCILQIGELVGKLSDDFKQTYNDMPWRDIKAMRNIAAHNYGEIDNDILWETVTCDLVTLKEFCEQCVD